MTYHYRKLKIFFYVCELCKKKRQTQKEVAAKEAVCKKCRATKVPENQTSIFDMLGDKTGENVDNL